MQKKIKNLFGTVLTYPAPSANYRGESEENRTVLQKISKNGKEYAIFSSEAKRHALREILRNKLNENEINRSRRDDEIDMDGKSQLSVEFRDYPDPLKYADDFIFGYMMAKSEYIKKAIKAKGDNWKAKSDSVLRINNSVALSPYKYEATFHQSPRQLKTKENENNFWENQAPSVLLHKEISHTAFQYPFALAGKDCQQKPGSEWIKALLEAIGELTNVAGGHARNYYEMSPKSIVMRLSSSLVAGYDTYGFQEDGNFAPLTRIHDKSGERDLPGEEFYIGGDVVRNLSDENKRKLENTGVTLFENPQKLLKKVAEDFLTEGK
jgi:CRISPR-associated protein Cst2